MAINSKEDICNLAISHLGDYGSVNDIENPKEGPELTFALWYDVALEAYLSLSMPNFAIRRKTIAVSAAIPPADFSFGFEYPSDCLRIFGIGTVEEKKNNYTVESGMIYTNLEYPDGLPIRYVEKYTDVSGMTSVFKVSFSWYLAAQVALPITQDLQKAMNLEKMLPGKLSELSGINAQENIPIRISNSRVQQARRTGHASSPDKRQ